VAVPLQPSLLSEPTYTRSRVNTLYWTSGSSPGELVEYLIERSTTSNFYTADIVTNSGISVGDESHQTSGTGLVFTTTSPSVVKGVYLESDTNKSANYYTSGSGVSINELRLATHVPAGTGAAGGGVQVVVDYTRSGWTPQSYDSAYDLEDGTKYNYRIKVRNRAKEETSGSHYVTSTQDDKVDSLEILAPTGKEFWQGGDTKELLWKAVDTASGLDNSNILISYSRDSGNAWNVLVSGSLVSNSNRITNETQTSVDRYRLFTDYQIKEVISVYPTGDGSGTNWFEHPLASGSSVSEGREIYLDYPLPSTFTGVEVTYNTYGKFNWELPTNLDGNNWRLKAKVYDNVGNSLEHSLTDDFTIMTPIDRLVDAFTKVEGSYTKMVIDTFNRGVDDSVDNLIDISHTISFDDSTYTDLTLHGSGFGLERYENEPDLEFRERIKHESRIANTKLAMLDYLDLYSHEGTQNLKIENWTGGVVDEVFFVDRSFCDYIDRITSGILPGQDPFTFDVWIRPKKYDTLTYTKIADAIEKTRPVSTKAWVRALAGSPYDSFAYGTDVKYGASDF